MVAINSFGSRLSQILQGALQQSAEVEAQEAAPAELQPASFESGAESHLFRDGFQDGSGFSLRRRLPGGDDGFDFGGRPRPRVHLPPPHPMGPVGHVRPGGGVSGGLGGE